MKNKVNDQNFQGLWYLTKRPSLRNHGVEETEIYAKGSEKKSIDEIVPFWTSKHNRHLGPQI